MSTMKLWRSTYDVLICRRPSLQPSDCGAPLQGYSFNNETDCLEATCQRCHETLHHGDRYCPSCGLPQLIYVPEETPVVMLGEERGGESAFAGGGPTGLGDGIAWRPAVKASILLAIPAG